MGKWLFLLVIGAAVLMLQPTVGAQQETAEEPDEVLDIFSGKVTSFDVAANKLVVTDLEGEAQEFALDPDLTIIWDDTADEEKEKTDLVVGKDVMVEFKTTDGKKTATWIDLLAVEEAAPAPTPEQIAPKEPVPVVE